jgi:hypothetical protein
MVIRLFFDAAKQLCGTVKDNHSSGAWLEKQGDM